MNIAYSKEKVKSLISKPKKKLQKNMRRSTKYKTIESDFDREMKKILKENK